MSEAAACRMVRVPVGSTAPVSLDLVVGPGATARPSDHTAYASAVL